MVKNLIPGIPAGGKMSIPKLGKISSAAVSGKKCILGVENMTLFMLFVIFILLVYMFMQSQRKRETTVNMSTASMGFGLAPITVSSDTFNDPYAPPLKSDGLYFPPDSGDIRGIPSIMGIQQQQYTGIQQLNNTNIIGLPVAVRPVVPVNVQTRSFSPEYTQIGILTRDNGHEMILPLMGRRTMNGRDKYQYYTISNTGSVNTKLPIKVRGKSCTSEYGCDEIMSGDSVYVEGYKETFQTTVYEYSLLSYIPYL